MRKHGPLLLFILLSGFASGLNYLTYPVLSRLLPNSEFINITVALSILTQMATFLSSIIALTVGITKSNTIKQPRKLIESLQSELINVFLFFIGLFILTAPFTLGGIE